MKSFLRQLLSASRYLVVLPVLGLFSSGVTLMVYGLVKVYGLSVALFQPNAKAKELVVAFVEATDIFLLSVAMYIIALGLYELFIDNTLELPEWLAIKDFDSLKSKLLNIIVIILGVSFLGTVTTWAGDWQILGLGVGVCAVMVAITLFLRKNKTSS
ncbi:MAG: YqhA family protein [Saprospiraceae bacterium]